MQFRQSSHVHPSTQQKSYHTIYRRLPPPKRRQSHECVTYLHLRPVHLYKVPAPKTRKKPFSSVKPPAQGNTHPTEPPERAVFRDCHTRSVTDSNRASSSNQKAVYGHPTWRENRQGSTSVAYMHMKYFWMPAYNCGHAGWAASSARRPIRMTRRPARGGRAT